MPELDLDAILARAQTAGTALASVTFASSQRLTEVMDSACDVADLVAEVQRLRGEVFALSNSEGLDVVTANAEIKRLQRLLDDGSFPTSHAYESMAVAMTAYRSVAEEMLKHFGQGTYGVDLVVSSPVPIETVTRWHRVLGGGS